MNTIDISWQGSKRRVGLVWGLTVFEVDGIERYWYVSRVPSVSLGRIEMLYFHTHSLSLSMSKSVYQNR